MNTSNPQTSLPNSDMVQLKIVADSAGEAVKTIKERFGESTKVLSVKQKEAGGLTGLLKKPRLEIVVEVPRSRIDPNARSREKIAPKAPEPKASEETATEAVGEQDETAEVARKPITDLYSKTGNDEKSGYFSEFEGKEVVEKSARLGSAANPIQRGSMDSVKRAVSMLKSVGFDDSLIERIRYELDFRSMGDSPAMEIYSQICDWLRKRFPEERASLKGDCRAFIGSNGAGKTAALCKALSSDIFINGMEPTVMKIDSDVPNPSDGLEAFCEIMGAPLYRSMEEIEEYSANRPIYVDMPGLNIGNPESIANCKKNLDAIGADERVIVVNAAYETELIAEAMEAGDRMGATHVVFTHLDETRHAGKLWKFALSSGIQPLFFCYGANPAGDYTMDPFSYLLEKTFPEGRSLVAAKSRKRAPAKNESIKMEAASA